MNRKTKRLKKLITFGALFIVPIVFALSLWFSSLGMNDTLSIFLIVLGGAIASFVYYLIFEKIEKRKEEKQKNKKDPFAN